MKWRWLPVPTAMLVAVEHDRRPKLDVRCKNPLWMPRPQLLEGRLLERLRHVHARRLELMRRAPQDSSARILGPVHAVSEAHDPLATVEQVADVLIDVVRLSDLVEHL